MGAWYQEDDVRSQSTGQGCILHPISQARVLWDYALRFLALSTCFIVPLRLAFVYNDASDTSPLFGGTQTVLIAADVFLDVLCFADVASNFLFGYVTANVMNGKRELVCDWRQIAIRYLRRSCALEVASIGIPLQCRASHARWVQWASLIKLMRLQRLIRVRARERHRAHEAGKMPQNVVVEKVKGISHLLVAFFLWSHFCGCLYCYIGRIQGDTVSFSYRMPWMARLREEEPEIFSEGGGFALYMLSLYWAMATALTMGFSDLGPRTAIEQTFCVIMMLFSSVLYASIFGQVTTLVESLDQINRRYHSELQRFTEFASIHQLPWSLRARMYAHVHYSWQVTRGIHTDAIFKSLSPGVRRDIQMYLLSSIVSNFPIFANTPSNFIYAVVEQFQTELLVANEFVFTADEPGRHLYIIHVGRVEVITADGVIVGKLSDGAFFGEIAILADVRRTSSVRTVCRCHFYTLSKEAFDDVLEGFPELRDRIVAKAMVRLQKTMRARSKYSLAGSQSNTKAVASLAAAKDFISNQSTSRKTSSSSSTSTMQATTMIGTANETIPQSMAVAQQEDDEDKQRRLPVSILGTNGETKSTEQWRSMLQANMEAEPKLANGRSPVVEATSDQHFIRRPSRHLADGRYDENSTGMPASRGRRSSLISRLRLSSGTRQRQQRLSLRRDAPKEEAIGGDHQGVNVADDSVELASAHADAASLPAAALSAGQREALQSLNDIVKDLQTTISLLSRSLNSVAEPILAVRNDVDVTPPHDDECLHRQPDSSEQSGRPCGGGERPCDGDESKGGEATNAAYIETLACEELSLPHSAAQKQVQSREPAS